MRRLTSQDAMFLAVEDRRAQMTVSGLAIVEGRKPDGTPLTRDDVAGVVKERLHLLAPLRWTLAEVPFGLGHPTWVDGDVDLDYHVRAIGLPPPGDAAQLEAMVARLAAYPLDRSRPLWELYVIEGLADDRVAVLTKLHHAAVDGQSGAEIMGMIFDPSPAGRELPPAPAHRPERRPGQTTLLIRGAASTLLKAKDAPRTAAKTLTFLDQNIAVRSVPASGKIARIVRRSQVWREQDPRLLASPIKDIPQTRFNKPVRSNRRVYSMVALPIAPAKALKNKYGATVNDVVVALTAGALRRWLESTDDLPSLPIVAAIPISVRAGQGGAGFGNQVGVLPVALPTNEPDAVQRLLLCRDELRGAKERFQAVPATLLADATDLIPPMLYGRGIRTLVELGSNPNLDLMTNLVISNVPGPPAPMYCAGAELQALYPVSTIAGTLGLNVTVLSYAGELQFGLIGDSQQVPDLADLGQALRDEMSTLIEQSGLSEGGS
jgi:WS/DGAT/MGAT family acyltransferase